MHLLKYLVAAHVILSMGLKLKFSSGMDDLIAIKVFNLKMGS